MATPTADKLKTYFPSRYIAADGNALTAYTVDAATARTISSVMLSESVDYWAGAIGWFDGDTITPELRSHFFHVRSFDDLSDTITLSRDLPFLPQAGDTFRLVIGGNRRSSQELFGLKVSGYQPELQPVSMAVLTGVTITKASGLLGEGDVTLRYDPALGELYVMKAGENYGVGLNVTTDIADGVLFAEDAQSYLRIDVLTANLPLVETTELVTLQCPQAVFTPDFEGYETISSGKERFRLEVIKNTDPLNTMIDLLAFTAKPAGEPTTINSAIPLTPAAGEFSVLDASTWPTHSFWVKNTTKSDCRYIRYRSGNTLYAIDAGVGLRGLTAVNWELNDAVEIMPDVDIAFERPDVSLQFGNLADETTPPVGLTFAAVGDPENHLYIGDLFPNQMVGIWRRETIVENHRARGDIRTDSIVTWS